MKATMRTSTLREFLRRHGINSMYFLAQMMATVYLEKYMSDLKKYSLEYNLQHTKLTNRYKSRLSRYEANQQRPERDIFLLMVVAIRCKREELEVVMYSPQDNLQSDNDSEIDGLLVYISNLLKKVKVNIKLAFPNLNLSPQKL